MSTIGKNRVLRHEAQQKKTEIIQVRISPRLAKIVGEYAEKYEMSWSAVCRDALILMLDNKRGQRDGAG